MFLNKCFFFNLRGEDEYSSQLESNGEELEQPLPLKSDNEWQQYSPLLPPHHYMHNYGTVFLLVKSISKTICFGKVLYKYIHTYSLTYYVYFI